MFQTILGEHSPINLVTDPKMCDVEIGKCAAYNRNLR